MNAWLGGLGIDSPEAKHFAAERQRQREKAGRRRKPLAAGLQDAAIGGRRRGGGRGRGRGRRRGLNRGQTNGGVAIAADPGHGADDPGYETPDLGHHEVHEERRTPPPVTTWEQYAANLSQQGPGAIKTLLIAESPPRHGQAIYVIRDHAQSHDGSYIGLQASDDARHQPVVALVRMQYAVVSAARCVHLT